MRYYSEIGAVAREIFWHAAGSIVIHAGRSDVLPLHCKSNQQQPSEYCLLNESPYASIGARQSSAPEVPAVLCSQVILRYASETRTN